jgi:flagellar hook-associated protein 3 FlgL
MRVTGNSFTESLMTQLNTLASQQYRLQNQVATGRRVQAPEDDPAAMQRAMGLRTQQQAQQQFTNNISALKDRAGAQFDAFNALQKISNRVGEIATLADGTKSADDLRSYATELTQLIKQAGQLMNSKQNGTFLFAGTKSDQAPFTLATGPNGEVTAVTYNGNNASTDSDIAPGMALGLDVPGVNDSGTGPRGLVADSRSGADFFNHLISLQNHLLAGDTASVASVDRPALTKDEDNFLYHITNNGAAQTHLDAAASMAATRSASLESSISKETDADVTDTIVQLNKAQYAYQAALQSGAGIMQKSLLDFLH